MQKRTLHKTTSPIVRKRVGKRVDKKKPGCKKSIGSKKSASPLRSNTLFTVILKPKKGFEVIKEISVFHAPVKSIGSDLLLSVNFALKALYNEKPIRPEPDISQTDLFNLVMDTMKKRVLPDGFYFNIEKDDTDTHYFILFKQLDFGQHWHYFPIKPIIKFLEKKDSELLQLYLSALNILRNTCRIPTWYGGNFYPYDMLIADEVGYDELVMNLETGNEEEDIIMKADWEACRYNYLQGDAHRYTNLITRAPVCLQVLKRKVQNHKINLKVVELINKIIAIAELGFSIYDFAYDPINGQGEYWDGEPLDLSQQVTIIWEEDDLLFKEACEHIDIHAGEFGVLDPCINIELKKDIRKKHFEGTELKKTFWKSITELWHYNYNLTRKINKK